MKVIFRQDIPRVGRKGDIRNVSEGYARNFLFPHRLAEPLTPVVEERVAHELRSHERETSKRREELGAMTKALMDRPIVIRAKANEKGTLFGKVSIRDIRERIHGLTKTDIATSMIRLPAPISTLGRHEVEIVFPESKPKRFTVEVQNIPS